MMRAAKISGSLLLASTVGFVSLHLFASELGPAETFASRLLTASALFSLTALAVGYLNHRMWMLAVVVGWGGFFLGISGLTGQQEVLFPLGTLLISFGTTLLGGFLGAVFYRKGLLRTRL